MLTTPDISDVELKQRWRLYWIETIFEFMSLSLQKMAWQEGEDASWPDGQARCSTLHEMLDAYFEDLNLIDAYQGALQWGNVSQEEYDTVQTLHQLIVFYDEPSSNPAEVLEDEEWLEIVDEAKKVWNFLKESVSEDREKALIERLERNFELI